MDEVKCGPHIARCARPVSACTGCGSCEIMCSLVHEGCVGPKTRRMFLKRDEVFLDHQIYHCQNCEDAACYNECPKKDKAMCYDAEKKVYYVVAEECIGCRKCVKACVFEPARIQMNGKKAMKCDLCRTRPEGPACIEFCNSMVLGWYGDQVPTAEEGVKYEG